MISWGHTCLTAAAMLSMLVCKACGVGTGTCIADDTESVGVQVQQRMQRLKEKLFQEVAAALEPSRQPGAGRWQGPWLLASRFLRHRHHQRHCRDLQARLHELHAAISSSIEAEVCYGLSACTSGKASLVMSCVHLQQYVVRCLGHIPGHKRNLKHRIYAFGMEQLHFVPVHKVTSSLVFQNSCFALLK